jgi:O-methyltransferase
MYQSTVDALKALYHKVSIGGYVIIDDYGWWPHCKQAIDDFRNKHCLSEEIITIDGDAIFWKVISNLSKNRVSRSFSAGSICGGTALTGN